MKYDNKRMSDSLSETLGETISSYSLLINKFVNSAVVESVNNIVKLNSDIIYNVSKNIVPIISNINYNSLKPIINSVNKINYDMITPVIESFNKISKIVIEPYTVSLAKALSDYIVNYENDLRKIYDNMNCVYNSHEFIELCINSARSIDGNISEIEVKEALEEISFEDVEKTVNDKSISKFTLVKQVIIWIIITFLLQPLLAIPQEKITEWYTEQITCIINWLNLEIKKLEEVCDFSTEKIEVTRLNYTTYISTENMTPNFGGVNAATVLPKQRKVNKFDKGNILISNIRPYFKKMWYATFDGGCSSDVIVLKPKKTINSKFLYYYLMGPSFFDYVVSTSKGTKMPRGDKDAIKKYELLIPNLDDQQKIVKILSGIDKKIEVNSQINNTLYAILKQLYTNLYINNKDYNLWENTTLDETTSKFATGLNPRKNFVLGEGNNYYVTIKNMHDNRVVLDDKCDKVTDEALGKINKRSDLREGDLLFSGIGTIGRTHLIIKEPKNWNISESVFTLRPNERITSEFLYLLLLSSDMQNYAVSLASGSVQKGIRMVDLKRYTYKLPDKKFISDFTKKIKPIIQIIDNNNCENDNLSDLRDTLLPKLMNGEIDLENIKI